MEGFVGIVERAKDFRDIAEGSGFVILVSGIAPEGESFLECVEGIFGVSQGELGGANIAECGGLRQQAV